MSSNARKDLFYYVTSGSNVMHDVHWYVTVDYQQIENGNIANQIHGFTIDYGKFILIAISVLIETELARAVDVMMARAERFYTLIIKVNKFLSLFSSRCYLKEIENMFSVFLSSYRNAREGLGEHEKAVETLACGSCSHSISRSPKVSLLSL